MERIKQSNARLDGYKFYLKAIDNRLDILAVTETPVTYNLLFNGRVIFSGKYKEVDAFLDGIDFVQKTLTEGSKA